MPLDIDTKNDARFKNETEDGTPTWAQLRNIDGHAYLLESTHANATDANARVEQIRSEGGRAQASTCATPKFAPVDGKDGLYRPSRAAVYHIPAGKILNVTADSHTVEDKPVKAPKEPKPKKEKKPKAEKKASAKKAPAKDTPAVIKAKAKLAEQATAEAV